jgi:hypothetical protein
VSTSEFYDSRRKEIVLRGKDVLSAITRTRRVAASLHASHVRGKKINGGGTVDALVMLSSLKHGELDIYE